MQNQNNEIIRILHNKKISNSFFNSDTMKFDMSFFNQYYQMEDFAKIKPKKMNLSFQGVPLKKDLITALKNMNSIGETDFSFDFDNENSNMVIGLFPDLDLEATQPNFRRTEFKSKNKGKTYKAFFLKNDNEYGVANVTLGLSQDTNSYIINEISLTKDSILMPKSKVRLRSDGKIQERVMTLNPKGVMSIANADYYTFMERYANYNTSVAKGSAVLNPDLISITSNVGTQTASDNNVVNIFKSAQVQAPFGIKDNAYKNKISETVYLSGNDMADLLNTEDKVDKNNFYQITFNNSDNEVTDIKAFSRDGKLIENFKESDVYKFIKSGENTEYLKRDKIMTKVGYNISWTRQNFSSDEIKRYNQKIEDLFKINQANGVTMEQAHLLAKEIITEQQTKMLNAYGFGAIAPNLSGEDYINAFKSYYDDLSKNGQTTKELDGIYSHFNNNVDLGVLTGTIFEGRRFDNFLDIIRQSANTVDKTSELSQSIFQPLVQANIDTQRKAQGDAMYPKLTINMGAQEIDVAGTIKDFFSSVEEMKYKQMNFKYLQGEDLLVKLGEKAGIDKNNLPNLPYTPMKVLYTDNPLAWQDSNVVTNAAAWQNISMKDNKKPFIIPYQALTKEVFGDATDEQIKEFYLLLQKKKYNIDDVSTSSGIEKNIIRNLLGEENYNKYMLGQSGSLPSDLEDALSPIKKIAIGANENEYIRRSSETTQKLNDFMNKYFMRSNGESRIPIIKENAVTGNMKTFTSGSNFNFLEGVKFTEQGIEFNLKHVMLQGHGSKYMLGNIKGTTQVLTDLLAVESERNGKMYRTYIDGLFNSKATKGSRGFAGTFFAQLLTNMAYNAVYNGELKDGSDIVNGVIDYQKRFDNFKRIMSDVKIPTNSVIGSNRQNVRGTSNIFDIFNIDIRYENGELVFDDKNVARALSSFTGDSSYDSLNGRINDSMREHFKQIFGRDLVGDEGRILGSFIHETMINNYNNVLNTMTEEAAGASQVAFKNATLYKSYIAGNKVGMANAGELGYSYLLQANFSMMAESKKRKTEDALKIGRLSASIFSENGFENIVKYMEKNLTGTARQQVEDYLALGAVRGSDYSRDTKRFLETFNQSINIQNDVNIYHPMGTNVDISSYLEKSPIGRLMNYDKTEDRLVNPVKGVIEGFSDTYMKDLKKFFNKDNQETYQKTLGKMSQLSIIHADLDTNGKAVKELNLTDKTVQEIRTKLNNFINKSDVSIIESIDTLNHLGEDESLIDAYQKYRTRLYDSFIADGGLSKTEIEYLKKIKKMNKMDNGVEFYKLFTSLGDVQNKAMQMGSTVYNIDVDSKLYRFNLKNDQINSLSHYAKNLPEENTRILSSLLKDVDSITGQKIYNLFDLEQISKYGNVAFIIDSLAADVNGKIVPNKMLSTYENILRTGYEMEEIERQKNLFNKFSLEEIKQLTSRNVNVEIDEGLLKRANSKLDDAFNVFLKNLTNPEDIEFAKSQMKEIYNTYRSTDMDFSKADDNIFYRLYSKSKQTFDKSNQVGQEISIVNNNINMDDKLFERLKQILESETVDNSNIKKSLNNLGQTTGYTNNQKNLLRIGMGYFTGDKFNYNRTKKDGKHFFEFNKFNLALQTQKNILKKNRSGENVYDDVIELENKVKSIIADIYKDEIISKTQSDIDNFVTFLSNGGSIEDFRKYSENLIDTVTNPNRASFEELQKVMLSSKKELLVDMNEELDKKKDKLTRLLMSRFSYLEDNLFKKDGVLYNLSSMPASNSAAFSPREASGITTFIRNEMSNILKNRAMKDGTLKESVAFNDLRKALELTYGKTLVEDIWKQFRDTYFQENLDSKMIKNTVNELKSKLDNFSHIVVGTKRDWELAGQSHLFTNGSIYVGMLSRHPHQYKNSLSPVRMVMLNETAQGLSFWGKYLGTGAKVDSTQSSLMFIGPETALAAKGDFDGDVFQIMSLGSRNKTIRRKLGDLNGDIKDFDIKSNLFYMLNNIAGNDLKGEFNNSTLSSRNKEIKRLIERVYFGGKKVSNQEAYSAINDIYLSLSHERHRVLQNLSEEVAEHANVPQFGGFYGSGDNKIFKQVLGNFLLTLDDKSKFRYLEGRYDVNSLKLMVENNINLSDQDKAELLNSIKKDNGEVVLNGIKKLKDDDNSLLMAALFDSKNKRLEYTGIAMTPEVHTKLNNFREVVTTLLRPEEMEKVINSFGNLNKEIYDSNVIRRATMGHTIGTLVEELAISSKKGNVSPNLILRNFSKAEKIISNPNVSFNLDLKEIGNINIALQQEAVELTSGKVLQNSLYEKIGKMEFKDWFKSLYLGNMQDKDFYSMMNSFLIISKKYSENEIKEMLNSNKTVKEIMFGKGREDLITALSNWSTIMYKGMIQRDTGIEEFNTSTYSKIFGGSSRGFYKRIEDLLNIVQNGKKEFGTRFNSLMFTKMYEFAGKRLEKTKTDALNYQVDERVENVATDVVENISEEPKVKNLTLDFGVENISNEVNTENLNKSRTRTKKPKVENINNLKLDFDSFQKDITKPVENIEVLTDNANQTVEEVLDTPVINSSSKIEKVSNEIEQQIKELQSKISDLTLENEQLRNNSVDKKEIEILNKTIELKQQLINDLNAKLDAVKKESEKIKKDNDAVNKIKSSYGKAKTFTQKTAQTVSNSDIANKAKEQIGKHKTKLALGAGAVVLASFFRIFQKSRPVVNLDINEEEYERSQGSIYRNLGQYRINTNIRELY